MKCIWHYRLRGDYCYPNAEETSEPVLVDLLRSPGTDSTPWSAGMATLFVVLVPQPAWLHRQRLRSPEIDSEESTPPAYVAWRAGTTNKVVVRVWQIGNRFLGSLKGL